MDAVNLQWSHLNDHDTGATYDPSNGELRHMDEYRIVFGDNPSHYKISDLLIKFQGLDLTVEEQAVATALCIMISRK